MFTSSNAVSGDIKISAKHWRQRFKFCSNSHLIFNLEYCDINNTYVYCVVGNDNKFHVSTNQLVYHICINISVVVCVNKWWKITSQNRTRLHLYWIFLLAIGCGNTKMIRFGLYTTFNDMQSPMHASIHLLV